MHESRLYPKDRPAGPSPTYCILNGEPTGPRARAAMGNRLSRHRCGTTRARGCGLHPVPGDPNSRRSTVRAAGGGGGPGCDLHRRSTETTDEPQRSRDHPSRPADQGASRRRPGQERRNGPDATLGVHVQPISNPDVGLCGLGLARATGLMSGQRVGRNYLEMTENATP